MANQVFVLDTNKRPLNPVHPGRARYLLTQKKAAVFKRFPFTIILKTTVSEPVTPLRLKIDPGSNTTGMAILDDQSGFVVFAAELNHRGELIKDRLIYRSARRNNRRGRKTRYRKPRFLNRARCEKWLPPSLKSRVYNIQTWVERFRRLANVQALSMELVRFDTQQMENPDIQGVEYQQGTLAGYEVREYLLEKWGRKCAYCKKKDTPLQIEHIQPRSKGGTNRVSNLTLACEACNQAKGNQPVEVFLKNRPAVLKQIKAQAKAPLKDAAAVNATRWDLYRTLKSTGLPVEVGSGGLTKFNRCQRGLPKTHWLDAVCVGRSTPEQLKLEDVKPLAITAVGHGNRQMIRPDKYGFARCHRKREKVYFGFQTGDMAIAVVDKGKKAGTYFGKIAVRASGYFQIKTSNGDVDGLHHRFFRKVFSADGYMYSN